MFIYESVLKGKNGLVIRADGLNVPYIGEEVPGMFIYQGEDGLTVEVNGKAINTAAPATVDDVQA